MKKFSVIFLATLFVVLIVGFWTVSSYDKGSPSCGNCQSSAIERLEDYLTRNGFDYEPGEYGDILFKYHTYKIIAANYSDDPNLLRFLIYQEYDKEKETFVGQVLNDMNSQYKVMKSFYDAEDTMVVFSVEQFLPKCDAHLDSIFGRNLDIIEAAYTEFHHTMKEME